MIEEIHFHENCIFVGNGLDVSHHKLDIVKLPQEGITISGDINAKTLISRLQKFSIAFKALYPKRLSDAESCGGPSAIGSQAGAAACQQIANHPPRGFRVWKMLWIIHLRRRDMINDRTCCECLSIYCV